MTVLTETRREGEFIVSECDEGTLSREIVTIISDQKLGAGTVLGKISASGKYTLHDAAATDGSQNAIAVLFAAVDASDGDKSGVIIARLAEVNGNEITWKSGISAPNKTAGIASLATQNIIVR